MNNNRAVRVSTGTMHITKAGLSDSVAHIFCGKTTAIYPFDIWLYNFIQFYQGELYSKTCLKRPHKKKTKIGFQDQLSLNAGHKYCRMLQGEHSAILSTFIKILLVIKIFALSTFERPL